jgi:hypothetical protein
MAIQRLWMSAGSLLIEKFADFFRSGLAIAGGRNDFDPVASRQDHAFLNSRIFVQAPQSVSNIGALECNAFTHLDGRAAMIQTDDDDVFTHALFEPAPMPAGEQSVPPKKVPEHDAEAEHREDRRFFSSQPRRKPRM